MRGLGFVVLALAALIPRTTLAQADMCGDPPPVADQKLEAELVGQAQIARKILGSGELQAFIKKSRTEIFSKYPNAEESRSNAFYEYQICVLILGDSTLSTEQKLTFLMKSRREFAKPVEMPAERRFGPGSVFALKAGGTATLLDGKTTFAVRGIRSSRGQFWKVKTVTSSQHGSKYNQLEPGGSTRVKGTSCHIVFLGPNSAIDLFKFQLNC